MAVAAALVLFATTRTDEGLAGRLPNMTGMTAPRTCNRRRGGSTGVAARRTSTAASNREPVRQEQGAQKHMRAERGRVRT